MRRPAGSTAALAVVLTILVGLSTWAAVIDESRWWALDLGAALLALVAAASARSRPVGAAAVAAGLAALSPAATPVAALGVLLVGLLRPFRVAVAVAVLAVAGHVARGLWRPEGLPLGWWTVLVAAGVAACLGWGALGRSHRALVASLADRARRAEQDQARRVAEARAAERTTLAREMHDVLAHRLSLLATYAGALEHRPDASETSRARAATVVREGAHAALEELRQVLSVLRGDEPDYETALPDLEDVPGVVGEAREAGTVVELHDAVSDRPCPPPTGRTAYRVVQEALTNARRHAPGQPVRVDLTGGPGEGLVVRVGNPVAGPVPETSDGHGLLGLTERARLVGGRLDQRRGPDRFELVARLPWPA